MTEPPAFSFKWPPIPASLSVVIPAYDDAAGLDETLRSLSRQKGISFPLEIIVANDGGAEDISEVCRAHSAREVLAVPNGGSYRARNLGLAESRGEFVGFVDANIIVPPNWCADGRHALAQADYVGGPIAFIEPPVKTVAYHYQVAHAFQVERYLRVSHFAPTANLFVRRGVFEALSGFDERPRSSGDMEFGIRVFRSGRFKQAFCPAVEVRHPARTLPEVRRRELRVLEGFQLRARLHPDVFARPGWGSVLLALIPVVRPRELRIVMKQAGLWMAFKFYLMACALRGRGAIINARSLLAPGGAGSEADPEK